MSSQTAVTLQGVTFAELSFSSDLIRNTLLAHPCLEEARREVRRLSGTPLPVWGNGAIFLFPYQPYVSHDDPVRSLLKSTHIIFADIDRANVGTALMLIPEESRLRLLLPTCTDILDALFDSD